MVVHTVELGYLAVLGVHQIATARKGERELAAVGGGRGGRGQVSAQCMDGGGAVNGACSIAFNSSACILLRV
jgi:hypothetical protein